MRKGQAGALAFVVVLAGVVVLSTEGDRAEKALGELTAAIDPHMTSLRERVAPHPQGDPGPTEPGALPTAVEDPKKAGDSQEEATDTAAIAAAPEGPETGCGAAQLGGDDAAPEQPAASGDQVPAIADETRPEPGGDAGPIAADEEPAAAIVDRGGPVPPAEETTPTAMPDQAGVAAPIAGGTPAAVAPEVDGSVDVVAGAAAPADARDARPDAAPAPSVSAAERATAPSLNAGAMASTMGETNAGGVEVAASGEGEMTPETPAARGEPSSDADGARSEAVAEAAPELDASPDATQPPAIDRVGAPAVVDSAIADRATPPSTVDRSGESVAALPARTDETPDSTRRDDASAARRAVELTDATPIIGSAAPAVSSSALVKVAVAAAPAAMAPVARPVAGPDAGAPVGEAVAVRPVPLRPVADPPRAAAVPAPATGSLTLAGPAITGAEATPASVAIENVEVVPTGFRITGRAAGDGDVRIYVDGALKGEVPTARDHTFTFEAGDPPPPGAYQIRAEQVGERTEGAVSQAEVQFRYVDLDRLAPRAGPDGGLAPPPPGSHRVVIERGDNLWNIAADHYGDGFRYTTIFRANFVQIAHPDLIFPGQVFDLPGAAPAADTGQPGDATEAIR